MKSESRLGTDKHKWTDAQLERLGRLVEAGQSDAAIATLFGCGRQAIGFQRRARLGLTRPGRRPMRPIPPDFAQVAPALNADECRRRYRCSPRAVRRWYAETGLTPRTIAQPTAVAVAAIAPPPPAHGVPAVPMTLERQAAHHLQRFGPTYACAVLTRREQALLPAGGRDRWMVHGRCLTTAEMLRVAAARGFDVARWLAGHA